MKNKFSRYIKLGMNSKKGLYKIEPYINPFFEKMSEYVYTDDVNLKFHFEIRIDTIDFQWGDEEGASNIKLFLKKGFIGASVTIKDEKINNQEHLFQYLKQYLNDALIKMILRLKKAKINVNEDLLKSNFDKYFDEYFVN